MMTPLLLLLVPLALAAAPEERIVNGRDVNIANFPWQVSEKTEVKMRYFCIKHSLLKSRFLPTKDSHMF